MANKKSESFVSSSTRGSYNSTTRHATPLASRNKQLKKFYDGVYTKGEKKHYSKFIFKSEEITPEKKSVLGALKWNTQDVLDVGCGTGELAWLIASRTKGRVLGIDYSDTAIAEAKKRPGRKNLLYERADVLKMKGSFDCVIIIGTLEHMDNPLKILEKLKKLLRPGGSLIVTSPNWSNVRGYILLALKNLYDARITLADIHYFTPLDFEVFAKKLKMKLLWDTIEDSWGQGEKMIEDFKKRLPKVVQPTQVNRKRTLDLFIKWLDRHRVFFEKKEKWSGAVGFYHFKK
jgi:2-polyprenyl-3-methyl-5-hydroxy-6-metoxy-1,4-benzoquinol methylase